MPGQEGSQDKAKDATWRLHPQAPSWGPWWDVDAGLNPDSEWYPPWRDQQSCPWGFLRIPARLSSTWAVSSAPLPHGHSARLFPSADLYFFVGWTLMR